MIERLGQKFGRWTAVERKGSSYLCECECGTKRVVRTDNLVSGRSISCGCFNRDLRELTKRSQDILREKLLRGEIGGIK